MRAPLFIAIGVMLALSAIASAASPAIFIFDVMSRPVYRASYAQMLANDNHLPKWMATPDAASQATADPASSISVGGKEIEVFSFCEPHNCGGHTMIVGFEDMGETAKGVLSIDGRIQFFGRSSAAERASLIRQLP